MKTNKICVVSHSGGLDSSTLMMKALRAGYTVLPVNYNYGQKNIIEMTAQQNVWEDYKKRYPNTLMDTIVIDFTSIIGGAISTFQKNRDNGKADETTSMTYYMPSRNLLFMSVSAVIGEVLANDKGIEEVSLGLGIHQHSDIYAKDYWDISPEFAERLGSLLALNDNIKFSVYAPYKNGMKSAIIEDMLDMGVPYDLTWTCYNPQQQENDTYVPCLKCEACLERSSQAVGIGYEDTINEYSVKLLEEEILNYLKA